MATKKQSSVAGKLISGLENLLDDIRDANEVPRKYRERQVFVDFQSKPYSVEKVKETRQQIAASQLFFAKLLGVSRKTVQAWESGRQPSEMARRFMDEIRRNPEYWKGRLREATKILDPVA